MDDEKVEEAPRVEGPLAEAIEVINQLIAHCEALGAEIGGVRRAKRERHEALSIAAGIPLPPKRKRGRPKIGKDDRVQRHLAVLLELFSLEGGRAGARTRLAQALAEAEIGTKSSGRRRAVDGRRNSRRNDLSRLPKVRVIQGAYFARCFKTGESAESAKARLDAALTNDDSKRQVFEIIGDFLHD